MASTKVPIELSSTPGIVDNSNATAITIDSSENVGIGTSSPASLLHLSSNAPTIQFSETDVGTENYIQASGGGFNFFADDSNAVANTTMGFFVDGSEKMRIDSSGRVGIGTNNPTGNLVVVNSGGGGLNIGYNATSVNYYDADTQIFRNGSFAEKVRIDSSGNVGIGTSSPTTYSLAGTHLDVSSASVSQFTFIHANTPSVKAFLASNDSSGLTALFTYSNHPLTFGTNNTERMRITSSGDLLLGTTSGTYGNAKLYVSHGINGSTASPALTLEGVGYGGLHYLDGTAYYLGQNSGFRSVRIWSGTSTASGVELSAGGTSWSSFSDERLKENIQDIGSVTEKIKDIRCVTFNRTDIEDSKETIGFIAQDFIGKFDQVLNKSKLKDGDDEEYYSIKYTETIPVLLKAIQEQQVLIEQLQAEVALLKGE